MNKIEEKAKSKKQQKYIFYLRNKYKNKKSAPKKYKWAFDSEWAVSGKDYKDLPNKADEKEECWVRYIPLFEKAIESKENILKSRIQTLQDDGFDFVDGYIRQGNETFLMLNNKLNKVKTITNYDIPVFGSLQHLIDASK